MTSSLFLGGSYSRLIVVRINSSGKPATIISVLTDVRPLLADLVLLTDLWRAGLGKGVSSHHPYLRKSRMISSAKSGQGCHLAYSFISGLAAAVSFFDSLYSVGGARGLSPPLRPLPLHPRFLPTHVFHIFASCEYHHMSSHLLCARRFWLGVEGFSSS